LNTWIDRDTGMGRWSATWDPETMVRLENRLDAQVQALFHDTQPEGCPSDLLEKQSFLRAHALLALLNGGGARLGRPEIVVVSKAELPAAHSVRDRLAARGIFVKLSRPDFIWNPYKDFVTPLVQDTWAVGGSHIHTFSASLTNEFRLSRTDDDLHFNRPHPEIPTLLAVAPLNYYPIGTITLPGSTQFYSYRNNSKTTELLDNVIWPHGRHSWPGAQGVQGLRWTTRFLHRYLG
jgi:hypothetical protein